MKINWNEQTVGDIVKQNMHAAAIFEEFGVDYCCGGRQTPAEACERGKIDEELLKAKLEQMPDTGAPDVTAWDTSFLVDYIVNTHHQYVRRMLPSISAHSLKVRDVHGERHPELLEITAIWRDTAQELESHLMKEERILFPFIKSLDAAERGSGHMPAGGFGSVSNPIEVMEQEHDSVGLAFDRMRRISDDFKPAADACATWDLFYRELREFERDLHMHIHLENNVLHPRAIGTEQRLANGTH